MKPSQLFSQRPLASLVVSGVMAGAIIVPLSAALGDQRIVKDYTAARGWSAIVPLDVDGNVLTDYLSYNATTGHAIVSVAVGVSGEQKIVRDYMAASGWTLIVPLDVDGAGPTDMLSYNATTGRAIVSVGVGTSGEQRIVKDYMAAPGWTHVVPLNVDGAGPTDMLSYNATSGRAIVSVGTGTDGEQRIVRDYAAAPGWTHVVPMNVDRDFSGLTDLLSYNAATGRAIVSIAVGAAGEQKIVKDYVAAKGWTAIVPLNIDCDSGRTDLLSYNAATGRAIASVGADPYGEQKIVKDYMAAPGWTSLVPINVDGHDAATDFLSYASGTGRAIVSVAESCAFGPH
jgi:uncharacterized membrane protein YciS (DUF1049 family)